MIDLKKTLTFAEQLAKKSGKLLLGGLHSAYITSMKDQRDLCTDMDLKVEKLIVSEIRKKFPHHAILAEEGGSSGKSEYRWIIDPIDGTKYFEKGVPLFTISIALEFKKKIILGAVFDPSTSYLYSASKGGGAFCNGRKIQVSTTMNLKSAILTVDISKFHELSDKEKNKTLIRLQSLIHHVYRIRALGVGSLALCYLAQGAFDAYFDVTGRTKYVDIAAGSIIASEAGAVLSDLDGGKFIMSAKHFFATNGNLQSKLTRLLM